MSLLLDALKKAEEAKRHKAGETTPASLDEAAAVRPSGAELSLEPVKPPGAQLPDLNDHIESVNADLAAASTADFAARDTQPQNRHKAPHAPSSRGEEARLREEIRNSFSAKATPQPDRTRLWLGVGIALLCAAGIGGWLWWQLKSVGSGTQWVAAPAPAQVTAPVTPRPAQATPPLAVAKEESVAPPSLAPPPRQAPARMSAATDEAQPVFAPASRIGGGVSIARGTDRVGPLLDTATTRLKTNDLDLAAAAYAEVLHLAPTNVDALIGLATISLRRGQTGSAERFYLQALEADPKNVSAQVGAIGLRHHADPVAAESRLKLLISANAEHPSPQFALGNVYAAQQRWAEAQQAYFNAFSRDSDNPDYAYNLAVSLDHLHQERLALKYYKLALGAATGRYAGFDAGRVAARIAEIQP